MTDTTPRTTDQEQSLNAFLYGGADSESLGEAARSWLDAVHAFGEDALASGVPVSEVLPATVQMLEGWMLARDAASLSTTWMALDGAVTVLERRLAETRAERDRLAELVGLLQRREQARRARGKRRHKGKN